MVYFGWVLSGAWWFEVQKVTLQWSPNYPKVKHHQHILAKTGTASAQQHSILLPQLMNPRGLINVGLGCKEQRSKRVQTLKNTTGPVHVGSHSCFIRVELIVIFFFELVKDPFLSGSISVAIQETLTNMDYSSPNSKPTHRQRSKRIRACSLFSHIWRCEVRCYRGFA